MIDIGKIDLWFKKSTFGIGTLRGKRNFFESTKWFLI